MELSDLVGLAAAVMGLVLGAAGVAKLVEPAATATTFTAIGLPSGRHGARALGVVETGVALWLLVTGSRAAAAVAGAAYLALTAGVVVLRRRSPTTPCGCFGGWSGPPAVRHVVVNLVGVASCTLAAVMGASIGPAAGSGAPVVAGWWLVVAIGAVGVILVLATRPTPTSPHLGASHRTPTKEINP